MPRRMIDSDIKREHARQLRLRARLERKFSRLFRAEINRASRLMIADYAATGADPQMPLDHYRNMEGIYAALITTTVGVFAPRISDSVKSIGMASALSIGLEYSQGLQVARSVKDINADFFARLAADYLFDEAIRRRITSVTTTTRQNIITAIDVGMSEGAGTAEIARNIRRSVPRISRARSALISRTEVHGASSHASDQAARALGLPLKKEWVAVGDDRTRDDHADINGDIVGMDAVFSVGGESMTGPGDPSASAGNVINCRCVLSYIVDDQAQDDQSALGIMTEVDGNIRNIVLSEGRSSRVEHLRAYGAGGKEYYSKGSKSSVIISPDMLQDLSLPKSAMVVHHNHPGSRSFSPQDMKMIGRFRGLKTMYAHGHDGSAYRADRIKTFGNPVLTAANDAAARLFLAAKSRFASEADMMQLFHHAQSKYLGAKGFVRYRYILRGSTLRAYQRNKILFDEIVAEFGL